MIYTELTKKAIKLMFEKHKDQTDKSGIPYVFHPWHVAERMDDEISATVALLHDLVEDTDVTFGDLEKMGFPPEVTDTLRLMTHADGTEYFEYVRQLAHDPVARKVKLSDLRHNSDISRMDDPTEKDLKRREKYLKAITYLESIDKE